MKLVRRARKSIRERRMKACINDLNSNLTKVEMRVFKEQKKERDMKRKALGVADPVPKDVLQGRMNPELYEIECRLHEEAGLPKPLPYQGYKTWYGAAPPLIALALLGSARSCRPFAQRTNNRLTSRVI